TAQPCADARAVLVGSGGTGVPVLRPLDEDPAEEGICGPAVLFLPRRAGDHPRAHLPPRAPGAAAAFVVPDGQSAAATPQQRAEGARGRELLRTGAESAEPCLPRSQARSARQAAPRTGPE